MSLNKKIIYLLVVMFVASCILSVGAFWTAFGEESGSFRDDGLYYQPDSVQSAGWWENLAVEKTDNGTHIAFIDCNYVTIRTTSSVFYRADGIHMQIANFEGDGICVAFSNMPSPDAYDSALRFYTFNREDHTGVMRSSCPDWGTLEVLGLLNQRPIPSSFDIRFEKKQNGDWAFVFNGQIFTVSEEKFAKAISDPEKVYVSFSAYGGAETINTYSFDLKSIHDASVKCAEDLTVREVASLAKVQDAVAAIGKVTADASVKAKIDAARREYDALDESLKGMVSTYKTLIRAEQNYYALNNEPYFDENNIVKTMMIASDNHIDTNDCTNYEDGSPQDRLDLVLKYASEKEVDAMLLIGDMTDWARFDDSEELTKARYQIGLFKESVQKNLSKDVSLFFTFGNHDSSESEDDSRVSLFYELLGDDFYANDVNKSETEWESGCRHAVIAGYDFISLEWDYTDERQNISTAQLDWLEKTLKSITASERGKPLFVLSHVPFSDTVYGSGSLAESANKRRLYDILAEYPEIILLTGHSHYPLDNQTFIYQSAFTHIACASTAYLDMDADGFLTDGGYKVGSSLIPYGHTTAQAIYMEIDGNNNIRLTRLDMSDGGKQILNKVIIPAPDLVNKTHLNFYTDARSDRFEATPFGENASLDVKVTGEDSTEFTFDTIITENVVQYYEIEIEDANGTRVYRSYAANWLYPSLSDMPTEKTVKINDYAPVKPYKVSVTAIDSYGNRSNSLLKIAIDDKVADEQDRQTAEALIEAIGIVDEDSNEKISVARAFFDTLDYEVQQTVNNASVLAEAEKKYDSLFTTIEEYVNMAKTGRTVVGNNYWEQSGELNYYNSGKGLAIEYRHAVPNVRVGLKSFDLDGLHLRFDGLKKTEDMAENSYPAIGFILGGTEHPIYTEPVKTGILLFLDTATGKLEGHPGYKQIITDPALKYENLKDKKWDVKFSKLENGDFLVEIAGKKGVLEKSYFDGSFTLTDTTETYMSISCWVDDGSFDLRLLSVHDKNGACYSDETISFQLIEKIENSEKEISKLKKITLESKTAIETAEANYLAIPEQYRFLVENSQNLIDARSRYEELYRQFPSDEDKPAEKGCGSNLNGSGLACMIAMAAFAMIDSSRRNKKRKRGRK